MQIKDYVYTDCCTAFVHQSGSCQVTKEAPTPITHKPSFGTGDGSQAWCQLGKPSTCATPALPSRSYWRVNGRLLSGAPASLASGHIPKMWEGWFWQALSRSYLQDLCVGPSAVGEGYILKVHPALEVVRGQVSIMHHGWLPVNELKHLLGGPHSLHQAAIDGAHGLQGRHTSWSHRQPIPDTYHSWGVGRSWVRAAALRRHREPPDATCWCSRQWPQRQQRWEEKVRPPCLGIRSQGPGLDPAEGMCGEQGRVGRRPAFLWLPQHILCTPPFFVKTGSHNVALAILEVTM